LVGVRLARDATSGGSRKQETERGLAPNGVYLSAWAPGRTFLRLAARRMPCSP